MDDHSIGIGDIKTGLDDCCGDQHIDLSVDKPVHDLFQFTLAHLSVGKCHARLRNQFSDLIGDLFNVVYTIVYIIHLTTACQFPADCLPYHLIVIFHHIRLDRCTVLWCFFQNTHIPDSDQTHVKSSRNRRRCQSQDIDILFHLLNLFFVGNTKALFLIDDQQSQIFKLHIFGQHPMGADQDIHQTFFQILDRLFLLTGGTEPAQKVHAHRKILHPLYKCIVMLLCKDRGRNQINHLFSLLDRLKCHTDRNLRLPIAHISADQPIHDLRALHILLCRLDRLQLILRLFKWKHLFKFPLPYRIRSIAESGFLLSGCIQCHQIFCDILYSSADLRLGLLPFLSAEFV